MIMMTNGLLLLVMTSLFSSGTLASGDDQPITATCCWPQQFQARLGRFSGTPAGGAPGVMEEEMLFVFDYPYKRWGYWVREYFVTNDYMEMIYVEDFRAGKATVANMQGCARLPLNPDLRMRLPCLPDDAKYVETSWLGNKSLPYDVWEWTENEFFSSGEETSAKIRILLSHDNCNPVSDIAWWTAGNFNYTAYIGHMTLHIGETDGVNDDPFADLNHWYDCKDYDSLPSHIDVKWDVYPEQIYLLNRMHASPSTPPDLPPIIG